METKWKQKLKEKKPLLNGEKPCGLLKQLLQNGEGTEFWELGNVKAIVLDDEFQDAVAVGTTHAEKMHREEVHAHEQADATGLVGHQEIAMQRCVLAETGRT